MKKITINNSAIKPLLNKNETQIIFQRHCAYNKEKGILNEDSVNIEEDLIKSFITSLDTLSKEELNNTYFLFTTSNTISHNNLKRCVSTTNIVSTILEEYLINNNIPLTNIINLHNIRETNYLEEPRMFTDNTGYYNFLKEKNNGMNENFWISFEEDLYADERKKLGAEGPDEIVDRVDHYIKVLQRYSNIFHIKNPNSRLIIWCGTHYDLISPLVKQKVLNWDKKDVVNVDYCGGISIIINDKEELISVINDTIYPYDSLDTPQLRLHF